MTKNGASCFHAVVFIRKLQKMLYKHLMFRKSCISVSNSLSSLFCEKAEFPNYIGKRKAIVTVLTDTL